MRIERDIINQFKAWKDAPDRKPILLKGARQIGKTWAMETFGRECFKYCVKFDFDRQPELKSVFLASKDPQRLIKELTLYCEQPIVAGETLMIFDEICSRQATQDDRTRGKGSDHQYVPHHIQGVPAGQRLAHLRIYRLVGRNSPSARNHHE